MIIIDMFTAYDRQQVDRQIYRQIMVLHSIVPMYNLLAKFIGFSIFCTSSSYIYYLIQSGEKFYHVLNCMSFIIRRLHTLGHQAIVLVHGSHVRQSQPRAVWTYQGLIYVLSQRQNLEHSCSCGLWVKISISSEPFPHATLLGTILPSVLLLLLSQLELSHSV